MVLQRKLTMLSKMPRLETAIKWPTSQITITWFPQILKAMADDSDVDD